MLIDNKIIENKTKFEVAENIATGHPIKAAESKMASISDYVANMLGLRNDGKLVTKDLVKQDTGVDLSRPAFVDMI